MHRRIATVLIAAVALSACGCQAGVMIGRILFGDPEIRPAFELQTDVRLEEQDEEVRVVCTSPSQLSGDFSTVSVDLPEKLLRSLKRRGVPVGDVDDALSKLDDLGGYFDPRLVAAEYDDGYLIHIDVRDFSLREPGSNLYRGRAEGTLTAYQLIDEDGPEGDGEPTPVEVFSRGFSSTYPTGHPVPSESTPESQFNRKFVSHLAGEATRMLVRYRVTETF